MLITKEYNRAAALVYARRWAYGRNPEYLSFNGIGGDCTNFVSQCLYAGTGVMNYTPVFGWYYITADNRTASWTGVQYLANFLLANEEAGPFAVETTLRWMQAGDVIQLGTPERFYHTLIVTKGWPDLLVAAHSTDALDRPLKSYLSNDPLIRPMKIQGYREWIDENNENEEANEEATESTN